MFSLFFFRNYEALLLSRNDKRVRDLEEGEAVSQINDNKPRAHFDSAGEISGLVDGGGGNNSGRSLDTGIGEMIDDGVEKAVAAEVLASLCLATVLRNTKETSRHSTKTRPIII